MTTSTERLPGRLALMVAHCAGMVDLVALPVWVGALIAHYGFDPQQAGGLATLFLVGVVASSLFFAPRLQRIPARRATAAGFGIAGIAFLLVGGTDSYAAMALLHAVAGAAAGCALSFTHGTIARSERPHRLFALVNIALGVFAVMFLGSTPKLVAAAGGPALFQVFGGVMLVACIACALWFPAPPGAHEARPSAARAEGRLGAPVLCGALGIACMAVVQAMMFSFLERIGADRGFGVDAVTGVLVALGIVNLLPAVFAALLERRWNARHVVIAGPIAQATLAATIALGSTFVSYAGAAMFFAAVMIFTHTFAFGLIARLDPSGRALAATPAMVMAGAAIGPVLGGTLVKWGGYGTLGVAAIVIAALAVLCFALTRRGASVPVPTVA